MTNKKKEILIITGRYLPGYKDGGPVRSIKNLTDFLGNEYNFKILTCDRDHGDEAPYLNIKVNDWNRVGNADVFYVPPKGFTKKIIIQLASKVDLVYICGCFSDYSIRALVANRFGKVKAPVVVAPMGLFMPNAMKKKPFKYSTFLTAFKVLGMFKNISWSPTSKIEAECIRKVISPRARCYIAQDLPRLVDAMPFKKTKITGELNVFFISRISPEKNLLQSIDVLRGCKSRIKFTIYGPIHNKEYWDRVQNELKTLPENIHVSYAGNVESEQVVETLKKEHVFLFLTIGENYSHAIQEALSAGCPCIISDQTPWQDLEKKGVGYTFPLHDNKPFSDAIDTYAEMSGNEFQKVVHKAHQYAIDNSNQRLETTGYKTIFELQ